ncbi:hypothetical protein LXN57_10805 [Actinoplanes sp. TRM88002]|uniref:Uncharacterized protein n=1 Tax=Paractinoplanes hotanensis TaxID=2906497 RepID=A0ABT0XW90_9ACTN|nr:hypothetical protein [Actinoplanes hotanensis]
MADSYRNVDATAEALTGPGAPPRDAVEVVYKFDVRENESADQLTERLTGVAEQFGGRLDSVLIHNIDGGSRDATQRAWDVLAGLQTDGRIDRIGLGNVRDEHLDQLTELNARSPVGILENSLDSLLRDTGVQDFVNQADQRGEPSPEVHYYGVRRLASSMGLDSPADLRGLASAVSTFYGDAPTRMIVSSGRPDRQAAARDDFDLAPEHPDHDGVDQFDAQVKVFNWRQRPTFATTNGPDVELDPPLRQWLNDAVTDSAAVRAEITAEANARNRPVDADFIAHWLTDRNVIDSPETLDDVRIPERYGLRSQHVDRSLGSVLRDLLGNTSCDWKAAIELTQLTLTPVDDWNNLYPHFGEIVTTQAGTGSDIASDAGSRTSSWAVTDVPAEVHDNPPAPRDVPAGITLLDDTEALNLETARNFAPRAGQFLVFAHGTPQGLVVGGKLVTAPQLARMLHDNPAAQGKQIVLISCDTGSDPTGFPAELARQDGITSVTAPDRTAFVTPSGRVLTTDATTFDPDGRPRPDLTSPGHWNTFTGTAVEPVESGPDLPTAATISGDLNPTAETVRSETVRAVGDLDQAVDFGPKKVTKKEMLEQIDGAAKRFTKSYGGGQSGRAVDRFRLRFARDKRQERAAQTLSHLSFQLHDTFRHLRDQHPARESLPKDLEVQGMLINNRLVFATNYNATVDLLSGIQLPPGSAPPLQRLLSLNQSDARRRAHLTTQDADEYIGRMNRSQVKLDAAFAGARDSSTARAMQANQSIQIVDAAPASSTSRATLRDLLTDPRHEGSAIMVRLEDAGDSSVHAEQKLMLAVLNSGLDPDDIHGTHLVMGKYRPCLGCWAALNAYANEGFPVDFDRNYGNYYTESVRSLIDHMPQLAGSVAAQVRAAADRLMSVSALSRQAPPSNAVHNNGPETVIPAHDAPNRGYVTPSDSETEYKQRNYETTARNLDFATSSRVRTLGTGRDKPFAPRAAQRVLTDTERAELATAWKVRDTAHATALFKYHSARGVSNQEMSEASGASAGHVGRLVNDKDGHEKRDGRDKVHRRVQSRSARSDTASTTGSTSSKFTKRPDLDSDGRQTIRDAIRGTDFGNNWKAIEKGANGNLQARHMPPELNQALAGLRQRYNIQSLADYVHIPRKSLQQHLDKRYGSVNEAATRTAAPTRQPSPIDEEMTDAPPEPSYASSSRLPGVRYSDTPTVAQPTRMSDVRYSYTPTAGGSSRMPDVRYSNTPSTAESSRMPGVRYSEAPIRYTTQPAATSPVAQPPPVNTHPLYTDEAGRTVYANDRGTQFYLNRATGRWQYYDESDGQWHDYRPGDPYGKGKGTSWEATDVTGTHQTAPPVVEVPAGLALLDPDQTDNWHAARNHRPRPDEFLVFAHGTPDGIVFQNKLVTPEQLAARITADPRSHGKQIVLVSCDTAAGDYDIRLSQQPGITAVTAPTQTAWITPSGRVLSASPNLEQAGQWRHTSGHPPISHLSPGQELPTTTDGAVAFGRTKKELIAEIDDAAKRFTKSYGGGQFGRAVDEFRLRFARDKRRERAAQTLNHLSFQLHDTFRHLRDQHPARESLPKDLEVQGMLINNRLVFATNYNATVDLLNNAPIPPGAGPPLQRLLSLNQSDARRRAHLTTQDADEYVGRMNRSQVKLDAAFAGARDSSTARAMRANDRLRIVDAAPATAEGRGQLHAMLTDPAYRGTTIVLRHADSGADSVHAEQKLMLAVHNAGLDPDDIHGTHLVMGKYRPCLGCWAALNAYAADGFPVDFDRNHGNYYTESVRTMVGLMPHLAGSVATHVRAATDRLMSVSALSRQAPPPDAYENNGLEKVIPVHDAPNRGYVTASDSETEWVEKRRSYVTTKRNLDLATGSRVRTMGTGRDKPFAPRAAQRVLTDTERAELASAWKVRDTAHATALFKYHSARGVSNQEMNEASGASASHIGRLIKDKDGHEKRDGREKVHRRVRSRSGRGDTASTAGSSTSKFTKRPDLDSDGRQTIRDAIRGTDFGHGWKAIEKGAEANLQARHIPDALNRTLAELRRHYNMQSLADYLHIPRKSLQQHLDKRYGSVNEAAAPTRQPSPIDEEMTDAPPEPSYASSSRLPGVRYSDTPSIAEPTRMSDVRYSYTPSTSGSNRIPGVRYSDTPSIAESSRMPGVRYSEAPIRYTTQPTAPPAAPANARPIFVDEDGDTIFENDRGTQFYLNRTTGRWQYYDESDGQWHDYRPGDPYGKGKGTSWATTDVHGTHEAPPPAVPVPAGLALLDDSEGANWAIARRHQARPGEYLVFAHGTPDGIVFQNKLVTPAQLAARITEDPRSHGRQIVLVSCDTGADDYDVRLAREPGITSVTAPTTTAWTTPSGRILTASPDLRQPGSWRHTGGHPPVTRTLPDHELPTPAYAKASLAGAVAFTPSPPPTWSELAARLESLDDFFDDTPDAGPQSLADLIAKLESLDDFFNDDTPDTGPDDSSGVGSDAGPQTMADLVARLESLDDFFFGEEAAAETALKSQPEVDAEFAQRLAEVTAANRTIATAPPDVLRAGQHPVALFAALGRSEDAMDTAAESTARARELVIAAERRHRDTGGRVDPALRTEAVAQLNAALANQRAARDHHAATLNVLRAAFGDAPHPQPSPRPPAPETATAPNTAPTTPPTGPGPTPGTPATTPRNTGLEAPTGSTPRAPRTRPGPRPLDVPDAIAEDAEAEAAAEAEPADTPLSVRRALPGYLRESRGLGLAKQLGRTENTDLATPLTEAGVDADTVARVQRLAESGVAPFLGDGHPFPVTVGNRPAELVVRAVFDWYGLTVGEKATKPGRAETKTGAKDTRTATAKHNAQLDPRAAFAALPPLVADVAAQLPAGASETRTAAHENEYSHKSTVDLGRGLDTVVPVKFVLTLRDAKGQIGQRTTDASATIRVPRGLTGPATAPAAHAGSLPARFGVESTTGRPAGHRDFFDQVAALLPAEVTAIGAPGRDTLRRFLDDATIAAKLPAMVAEDGDRHPEAAWITSEPLLHAPRHGRNRLRQARDGVVQMRLVPRQAQVTDTVAEATHTDTQTRSGEDKDTNTATRTVGLTAAAGAGTETGAVRFAVGPRVGFSRTTEHGQEHTVATTSAETSTVTGPAGRYHVVYDLEVRTVGRPATRLDGAVESFQWARQDRIERAGLVTGTDGGWRGLHGPDRQRFAPAHVEQGTSFGGTIVDDFSGGDQLYEAVSRALRTVPGRRGHRVLSNAFLGQFDDPALTDGLTAGVQALIARDTKARNALSDRQLALLLDRIVGPGLEVPLVKNGHLHDYHTVVKVTGVVGELSDGGVVAGGAFGTGGKLKTKTGTQAGRTRTDKAEVSVEGRVYGTLGRLFGTLTFGPKITRTGAESHTLGVTQSGSHTHEHGGALDDDGSIAEQRMVEFLAPLTLTTTSTSYRRLNTSGRRLTLGRPGRDIPRTVEPPALPARSHRVDVRLLVPEHRVTTTPPAPGPAAPPPATVPIEQPPPVSQLPGGYTRDLDGNRIEAFTAAADLQAAVKETLIAASGDPIFGFPDGVLSAAVADTFSPENLRGDPRLFSRPIVLDGLTHPRRVADVHGRVGVRLRPANPQVLSGAEYERAKQSRAGGVIGKQSRGHQWEASASATGSTSLSGLTGRAGPGGLLMAQFQPFVRRWGRARGQELTGNARLRLTGRPEHRVPVRLDIEAEVVAETRRRGNIDRFDVFSDDSVHRAGRELRRPGAVIMWMTEEQVHRLREADLDRAQVDRDIRLGQVQLAEAAGLLREQRDALGRLARRQVLERATADPATRGDQLRLQRRAFRELRLDQGRDRLDLRTRHAAEIDALTEAKRGELLALAAERPVAAPATGAGPRTLTPPGRSIGLGGVSTPVDLTDRIPHLRRRLAETLGDRAAERLLPVSPLRTPHDNSRTVHDFLADLDRHLASALNGGRSQPLRLEDRVSGHTYYLTARARFPDAPRFAGITHVEQLGTAGKVVLTTTDTRSSQRTAFGLTGAARVMGLFRGAGPAGTGHGPASGTLAAGLRATAELFGRDSKRVETGQVTHKRAAQVAGPVATWDGDVEIELTISRGQRFEDGDGETSGVVVARDIQVRPVGLHTLAGDTLPEPVAGDTGLGRADLAGALPRAQRTPAARQAWRDAPGHPRLPEAGRFGVEHVLADLDDLRAAAARAITDSGGAVDASTIAALRDGLSVDNLRTALPAMLDGGFRVPLPAGGDRVLHVDARLVPHPRLAGVDARIELSGSRTHDEETKLEKTTGTTYGAGAVLPAAGGGVTHPEGGRPAFGAMSASSQREQQLFESAAHQLKAEATAGKTSAQQQPTAGVAADSSKLTKTLSYGLEFRFVVTSAPTRRAPAGHRSGGTELRIHDAVVIRSAGDDVPPVLRAGAERVAEASKAWTTAVATRDGLRGRGAEAAAADAAVARAEQAWWTAVEDHRRALAAHQAGA